MRQYGASLVELMIGLAIFGIVLGIAIPSLISWMENTQVRAAAESILNGVQIARGEAVRRNAMAKFSMNNTNGTPDWSVAAYDSANGLYDLPVQSYSGAQDKDARAGTSSAATQDYTAALAAGAGMPASVTFNALGRVVNVGTDITRIDVTNSAASGARRLVIIISPYGLARLCDPLLSLASNPQGCA